MVLSDKTIKETVTHWYPLVEPLNTSNLGPASVDLTLANDVICEGDYDPAVYPDDHLIPIEAGEFLLASTREVINVPKNMVAVVKGKSSLARMGLMVECAGFVDPGFSGQITLEVKNLNRERTLFIKPGMKICQIVFMQLDNSVDQPYSEESGHHYQGQQGATKAWNDKELGKESSNE